MVSTVWVNLGDAKIKMVSTVCVREVGVNLGDVIRKRLFSKGKRRSGEAAMGTGVGMGSEDKVNEVLM